MVPGFSSIIFWCHPPLIMGVQRRPALSLPRFSMVHPAKGFEWSESEKMKYKDDLPFISLRFSMVHPIKVLNGLNQKQEVQKITCSLLFLVHSINVSNCLNQIIGSTKTTLSLFLFCSLWFTLYKSFEWSESEYSAPCIWEHTHV